MFSAVSIVAETIGTLPLKVFRKVGGNTEEQPLPPRRRHARTTAEPDHTGAPLLGHSRRPPVAVGKRLHRKAQRRRRVSCRELWLIHPANVEVQYNDALRTKRYKVGSGFNATTLGDDRVLHLFGYSTDGLYGRQPDLAGPAAARTVQSEGKI